MHNLILTNAIVYKSSRILCGDLDGHLDRLGEAISHLLIHWLYTLYVYISNHLYDKTMHF